MSYDNPRCDSCGHDPECEHGLWTDCPWCEVDRLRAAAETVIAELSHHRKSTPPILEDAIDKMADSIKIVIESK